MFIFWYSITCSDFVLYVIDVRPLSVRAQKKGDSLRYVEVYVVDQSLSATATVLTVWDNIYEQYVDMFGHGFTKPFILTAIGLKVKDFRGAFLPIIMFVLVCLAK